MSKSLWGPPSGFAIRRNGSCLQGECSTKAWNETKSSHDFFRCCPSNSICSDKYTGICCPDEADCRATISKPAHCANETWDLYQNDDGGYFCCDQSELGFKISAGVGCAVRGDPTVTGRAWLPVLSPGVNTTSSSSAIPSTSPTSSTTSSTTSDSSSPSTGYVTPSSYPTSSSSSSSHTGAIAGGVVGGVVGLAIIFASFWFFMRRRPKKQSQQDQTPVTEATMAQYHPVPPSEIRSELDSHSTRPSELEGPASASELPGYKDETPTVHELPENPSNR
ncbi:hypothetical protein PENCOP_c013G04622 [Penicillium coprophilum]|uniref:Epidermal growth factor receptor-like transmembrane-juxtamembrane segment domain-containing protein n=1 Tax=Penicillium coprophilum TaxID=36646 RepID=A0A1V6UBU6_9EURO|nr:hypothetical protein PENCOP_c013G04622 [Penicillium coprophilum]